MREARSAIDETHAVSNAARIRRRGVIVAAAVVGWVLGAYAYAAGAWLIAGPPAPGDIPIGVFPCGLAGVALGVTFARARLRR